MKNFFKMIMASCLGSLAAGLVVIFVSFFFIGSMFSTQEEVRLKKNTLLKLTFKAPIVDFNNNIINDLDFVKMEINSAVTLYDMLKSIDMAASDSNIKGIYMDLNNVVISLTAAEEIRRSLLDFKKSGKFIISYADNYSQTAYFLASVSDKIYINPYGSAMLKGMASEVMFYKNALDKMGVDMQVIRHGKFKSAVEPYMLTEMSPENRQQIETYMGSMWNFMLEEIGASRNISVSELNRLADKLVLKNADSALNHKLVDGIMYKDEFVAKLCEQMGVSKERELNTLDMLVYATTVQEASTSRNRVAVIYASGEIVMGNDYRYVSSDAISYNIRRAREDKSVKAIVFRVNSPGGDAQASEIIARELELTAKEKPVVVSMGSLAASGGYWISTPASYIVTNHTTLTGSIGVFGVVPNIQKGMNDLTGLTVDVAKTNEYADMISIFKPLTAAERSYFQEMVEDVYDKFTTKVAASREKTKEAIDSLGQGRVWSGVNAVNNGLADSFGGLREAISLAANEANISDFRLLQLPSKKNRFEDIVASLMAIKILGNNTVTNDLKQTFSRYEHLVTTITHPGVKARMEYDVEIY